LVVGSSIGSERTLAMGCTYAHICTHMHPYTPICAHAGVLLGAPTLLPAPPYCIPTTTPSILNYLNAHMFIFYPPRPVESLFFEKTQNKGVFHTSTITLTPIQLIFTHLTPQLVAYDLWGGGGVIG
jgi:hypothetical protein